MSKLKDLSIKYAEYFSQHKSEPQVILANPITLEELVEEANKIVAYPCRLDGKTQSFAYRNVRILRSVDVKIDVFEMY